MENETWDVFISHASEDKKTIVEPLVKVLKENGISCWYDDINIGWGDSLTDSINNGLKKSKYVIVVLSESFRTKNWAKAELNSMLNMEFSNGQKKVLPLIVGDEEVCINELPLLRDKKYILWNKQSSIVMDELKKVLNVQVSKKNRKYILNKKYLLFLFLLILIGLFISRGLEQTSKSQLLQSIELDSKREVLCIDIENLLTLSDDLLRVYLHEPPVQNRLSFQSLSEKIDNKKDSILLRSKQYIEIKNTYEKIRNSYNVFLLLCQEKSYSLNKIQKIDINLKKLQNSIEILKDLYDSEMLNLNILKKQQQNFKLLSKQTTQQLILFENTEKMIKELGVQPK